MTKFVLRDPPTVYSRILLLQKEVVGSRRGKPQMLAFPPSERIQMLLDPLEKFRKGGIQHQKGKRIPA